MSDLVAVVVPRDLYYHEVAYVRELEAKLGEVSRDEPIFVLRAQDMTADEFVDKWCDRQVLIAKMPPEKIEAARKIAQAMRDWPHRKIPD